MAAHRAGEAVREAGRRGNPLIARKLTSFCCLSSHRFIATERRLRLIVSGLTRCSDGTESWQACRW